MIRIAAALSAAIIAMASSATADEDARYAVDLSIEVQGVEVASGRTLIREGGASEMQLCTDRECYRLEAGLSAATGGELLLTTRVLRAGSLLQSPKLTASPTQKASIAFGQGGELIRISLSPTT